MSAADGELSGAERDQLEALIAAGERRQEERYSVPRQELFTEEDMATRFAYLRAEKVVVDLENPKLVYPMKAFRELTAASREMVERRLNRNVERRLVREAEEALARNGNTNPAPAEVRELVLAAATEGDWIVRYELVADRWLRSETRIDLHTFTFSPNAERIALNMERFPAANLWSPPRITEEPLPADWESRAAIFSEHIQYLVPDERESLLVLRWIAHLIQKPERLPGWHLLLVAEGVQGTGRNWIARCLAAMLPETTAEDLPLRRLLEGKHNSEIEMATLGIVDEIRAGGNEKWELSEELKSFLSAKSRTINPKYVRPYVVQNFLRVMMFSNHIDALPLPAEDRRHLVARCTTEPRSEHYYTRIYAALEDRSTLRSIHELLMRVPIGDFNAEGRAPETAIKHEMIKEGRADEETELRRIIDEWPSDVMRSATLRSMLQKFRDNDLLFGEERHRSDQLSTGQVRRLYRVCGVKAIGQIRMAATDATGANRSGWFRVVAIRNAARWEKAGELAQRGEVERGEGVTEAAARTELGARPQ